jgi:hypothetical protein
MNAQIARRPVAQRVREWLIARCLAPINIDGSQVQDITIDGQSVSEVTMDGQQVFGAIPDSADLHHGYDVRELSLSDGNTITNIPDENGDDLDSTSTGPTYKTGAFGGTEPVARFNGSDQYIEVTSANFTSVQTAYTVFFSGSLNDSSGTQFATGGSDDDEFDFSSDGSNWFFYTDEGTSNYEAGGTPDENDHIFAFRGDGNNSEIWIDNSQVSDSPNTDTNTIDAISWGRDGSGNDYGKWDITEMLIYDGDKLGKQKIWDHMDRNTNIL